MEENSSQTEKVTRAVSDDGETEIRQTAVQRTSRASGITVVQRVIWFIVGVISVVLLLRILLLLIGANQGNGFVDLVYAIGGFFAAPFSGIVSSPTYGVSFFDSASVVAIVVYLLLGWGASKLVTLGQSEETL